MLIEQRHFPLGNGGAPWGTIILVTVIVAGLAYTGYKLTEPKVILKSKTNEDEDQ
jgi:hypothetical protein